MHEAWFEDFGEATLTAGAAVVTLDPDFAAVVDTSKLYVFLTPHFAGGNGLAVTVRTTTGFTVVDGSAGKLSGGFAYRVVAKRKDIPSPRLAKTILPSAVKPTLTPVTPVAAALAPSRPTVVPVVPIAPPIPPVPDLPAIAPVVATALAESPPEPSGTATPAAPAAVQPTGSPPAVTPTPR